MSIDINWEIDTQGLLNAFKNLAGEKGRKATFEVLEDIGCAFSDYLMYTCPVLTGRYRAGWTGLLNKAGKPGKMWATNFQHRVPGESSFEPATTPFQAIAQGMSMASVVEDRAGMQITIINSVPYGPQLEYGPYPTQHIGHLDRTISDFMSQNALWGQFEIELQNKLTYVFQE